MDVCRDYEDLFKIFNSHGVKYLLVGGQAVIYYTEPRYTKDIDVWVIPEMNDPKSVFAALHEFGAPLQDISAEDFKNKKLILQIGVAPVRIDILLNVEGVSFAKAWKNRKKTRYACVSWLKSRFNRAPAPNPPANLRCLRCPHSHGSNCRESQALYEFLPECSRAS